VGLNTLERKAFEEFWEVWKDTESTIWDWLETFHAPLLIAHNVDRRKGNFVQALQMVKAANLLPSPLRQALYDLSQLRNVFAHNLTDKIYGVPSADALPLLKKVNSLISKENFALKHLGTEYDIQVLQKADPMVRLLRGVREFDYSQFPVMNGHEIVGLVTTNTFARWLSQATESQTAYDFLENKIDDLLEFVESFETYTLLSRSTSLLDYWAITNPSDGRLPPRVIIFTEDGTAISEILRISTDNDRIASYMNL
jgi:hypothetical protein